MPQIIFIDKKNTQHKCDFTPGESIMNVGRRNDIIEGACNGAMACSTCHVIIDKEWVAKLPPARRDENDMLDLAPGVMKSSRLGCQIILTSILDGMTMRLP